MLVLCPLIFSELPFDKHQKLVLDSMILHDTLFRIPRVYSDGCETHAGLRLSTMMLRPVAAPSAIIICRSVRPSCRFRLPPQSAVLPDKVADAARSHHMPADQGAVCQGCGGSKAVSISDGSDKQSPWTRRPPPPHPRTVAGIWQEVFSS